LALHKSKFERFLGVFFIIRSKYGIKLIDRISHIKPGFWKFIADYSVYLSLGGIGAYYLSAVGSKKSLYYSQIFYIAIGFLLAAFLGYGVVMAYSMLLLSTAFAALLYNRKNTLLDFAYSSFLVAYPVYIVLSNTFVSMLIAFFGMPALLVYALGSHSLDILAGSSTLPGVSPMLPTSRGGEVGVGFPGFDLFIPWWSALVAIIITLVSHEAAHGILTRVSKVKLKSTGILSFGALPLGAFVEPDDDELNKKKSVERMRVYTMGSFANLAVGVFSILLVLCLLSGSNYVLIQENGLAVIGLTAGYPAEKFLSKGDVIYSIDHVSTDSLALFQNATASFKPGQAVELNTSRGVVQFALAANPDDSAKGQMGVLVSKLRFPDLLGPVNIILEAMGWIIFFNLNIALVNLLPLVPFDGSKMFKEIVDSMSLSELNVKRIFYGITALTAVFFLINAIPLLKIAANAVLSFL
ncbi:MAG: site-2 protease family protein, partial [Candidatus Altiarchaeota archaeon]|nr:site-2 protease family protein [Candidatus Altiarchaeota archaeon]